VYCDTRRIIRELDRRVPAPPLLKPDTSGISTAIESWAERDLFWPIVRYVSGINAGHLDPQLHVDRAALRGKHPPSIERLKAVAHRNLAQLRPQLPVVERLLAHGNAFLVSHQPGLADLAVYHGLWFLSAFEIDCSGELRDYPSIRAWMARVAALGHGAPEEMTSAQALVIAKQSSPEPLGASIEDDSLPAPGTDVAIGPEEYAGSVVTGTLAFVDRNDIAVRRIDPLLGETLVHFPRIGYSVRRLES
jgi:glutathione S-transferase